MSPRTEQVSIYLRYISGGLTKETFIEYSLRPSKTGTAIVHYYFFSLAGPRDKQVVFAIRAKLGLTPQMDVRPYAYVHNYSRHASVTTMLQHLDLPTLQQRRQHSKIIMLYRITHKLASIPTATYIAPCIRNTQHYILPYARTHVFKTSFFPSTIKIWNNLQPVITNSTTIPQLRQALQSTPTSGRRGAPCSAGSEWTPHAY